MAPPSLRAHLLVATPTLVDPNFDRSVIFVLESGEEGALGIVLNRPSATALEEALPEWDPYAADPGVVFVGGPVAQEAVIALARAKEPGAYDGWIPIVDDLGTIDVGRDPLEVPVAVDALRVFVGYAGWAPGQLEDEIDQGAWFVVDAIPRDPFTTDPAHLWRDVLRRQRGRIAIFAHCPTDPMVN